MTLAARFQSALSIQGGEERTVALVLSYGFALGMGRALCATAISGIFLSIFGAQAMPFVFIGTALVVPFTGIAYLRLQARLTLVRQIAATLLILMLALLALRAALGSSNAPWLVMAAMIGYTILYVLVTLSFWGLSGQIFNVRQAKRLFGLLGSGSETADIVGGILTILLAPRIGSLNLLFLSAAAFLAALFILRAITRSSSKQLASNAAEQRSEPAPKLPIVLRSKYIRLILALIVFSQLAYFFVENIFYALAMAHFRGPEQFAGLVGGTIAATSIITLLLQMGVAGRLANRYGIQVTQVVLPTALLIGAVAVALSGTLLGSTFIVFAIMLATRIGERALRFSVEESSVQIAYQPLPAAQRSLVQTLVAGGVRPLTAGVAGGMILLCTRLLGFGGVELAYVLVLICVIWFVLARAAGQAYSGALMQAMSQRRISGASLDLRDSTSLEVVQRGLRSPHPGEALYALQLLGELTPDDLSAAVGVLLAHPDSQVRCAALERIEQQRMGSHTTLLIDIAANDADAIVRGQALRTLAILGHPGASELIATALTSAARPIRKQAAIALARTGDRPGTKLWLNQQIVSSDATERQLAAQVIGESGDAELAAFLPALLADPDAAARNAALSAIGQLPAPELWNHAIAALDARETHGAASAALIAGGVAVLPALQATMRNAQATSKQRVAIARICGRIGDFASTLLIDSIEAQDVEVRQQAITALVQSGYRAESTATARVEQQIMLEATLVARLMAAERDIGEHTALIALHAALARSRDLGHARIFGLLSMLFDPQIIRRARENLTHSQAEQRAYAVESIDILLPQRLRLVVLPLIESADRASALAALERSMPQPVRTREQWLVDLSSAGDHWIRSCAQYAAVQLGITEGKADPHVVQLVERVAMLRRVAIFAEVPDDALAVVAQQLQPIQFAANTDIFARGDVGDSIYFIINGRVRVHDSMRTLNILGEHDVFGEAAALEDAVRAASVTTLEPVDLLRLDRATLYELIGDHVSVAHGIIRVLIRNLRGNVREIGALDRQLRAMQSASE